MADQLISQSDVDALVSSLGRNEQVNPSPAHIKPLGLAAPNKSTTPIAPNNSISSNIGLKTVNTQAAKPPQVNAVTGIRPRPSLPIRPEPKSEISVEVVNNLNAKIAEMTKQLSQMGTALKQVDLLEKKIAGLEAKLESKRENQAIELQVLQLGEALKKITANLKGTPGYGVRHTFNCEKCQ